MALYHMPPKGKTSTHPLPQILQAGGSGITVAQHGGGGVGEHKKAKHKLWPLAGGHIRRHHL